MKNSLLKVGQVGPYGLGPVCSIYLLINTLIIPSKSCIILEQLSMLILHFFRTCVTLSINRVSPHSFE
jgi:hypothetical protein